MVALIIAVATCIASFIIPEVRQLFGPHNYDLEKRRQQGYYLNDLKSPCKEEIGDSISLLDCDCFLQENEGLAPHMEKP